MLPGYHANESISIDSIAIYSLSRTNSIFLKCKQRLIPPNAILHFITTMVYIINSLNTVCFLTFSKNVFIFFLLIYDWSLKCVKVA